MVWSKSIARKLIFSSTNFPTASEHFLSSLSSRGGVEVGAAADNIMAVDLEGVAVVAILILLDSSLPEAPLELNGRR